MISDNICYGEGYSFEYPTYSKKQVRKAGERLVTGDIDDTVLSVLNNWRTAHALPLHIISSSLNNIVLSIDNNALLAKRLKRTPSIINKLRIQKDMSLARMQDIGGCRVIVDSIDSVYHALNDFKERMSLDNHQLMKFKDYIKDPKSSGYRGIHLIYKFNGENISDKHNGMLIEAQIRTNYQHYWATAVETLGTYLKQAFKSSQGDERYLELFSMLGDLFAAYENQPLLEQKIEVQKIAQKALTFYKVLQVDTKLLAFSHATRLIENEDTPRCDYYLVISNFSTGLIKVYSVKKEDFKRSNELYTKLENRFRKNSRKDVALVSAKTLSELRDTYPNYFSDTKRFIEHFHKVIEFCLKFDSDKSASNEKAMSDLQSRKYIIEIRRNIKKAIRGQISSNRALARRIRSLRKLERHMVDVDSKNEISNTICKMNTKLNNSYRSLDELRNYINTFFSSDIFKR